MAHLAVEGLEVATAIAELADATADVMGRRAAAVHQREAEREFHAKAEAEIAKERAENERLRSTLKMYQEALASFKEQGLLEQLEQLQGLSPDELCDKLKERVDSPQFLKKLDGNQEDIEPSWVVVDDGKGDHLLDDFVIVSQEDVIDSIANYMAKYVSKHPKAKEMTPEQLQKYLSKAFTMKEPGFFKRIWRTGRVMYTVGSWTATAIGLYRNPLIIRGALVALWTIARVLSRVVRG